MTEVKTLLTDLRGFYFLDLKGRNEIVHFIRGINYGRGNHFLTQFIRAYLKEKYQIDCFYMSWGEAVDTYAARNNKLFRDGFLQLLKEIHDSDFDPIIDDSFLHQNYVEKIELDRQPLKQGQQLESVLIGDNQSIKVGDWCQLADKIGDDYKQTKFFDYTLRDPLWDLFYQSDKDFKHVRFIHSDIDPYLRDEQGNKIIIPSSSVNLVRRLLSNHCFQIEKIIKTKDSIFLYSKYFEVDVAKALDSREVNLEFVEPKRYIRESTFEDLEESIENYEVGVMDIQRSVNELYFGIVNHLPKKEAFSWCNYYVHGSWKSRKY